jgi:hypothetical protein
MRLFGLTPDQVLARTPPSAAPPIRHPSLVFSLAYGALSFGLVSVLAYSIWAYRLIEHTGAQYSSIAAIYIGFTGFALSRLVLGPGAATRFALLFAVAFLAYALAWCAFWFGLRGKHQADLWGAVVGLAAMTFLMRRAFTHPTGLSGFLHLFLALFALHSLGYYAGEYLYAAVRGKNGRLLWGAAHGVGFGAGLGYVLYHVQAPIKKRLSAARTA